MQTLNQDIKEQHFRPVYLLYGDEAYLKNSYKKRLTEAIIGDDTMNFARFEGKNLDLDEVVRLADTMPFFAERRLILIEDSDFFKSASERIVECIAGMPDTTCFLFVESDVDKRNRLFKRVKELGYAAELGRQNAQALAKWSAGILAAAGKKITGRTMEFFLGRAGDDMEHIKSELEKLISYAYGREEITAADVEAVCSVHVENKIFDMVNAIVNRQTRKALDLYQDLLTLKEPPMRILFLIARQFNQLLQVKELVQQGRGNREIASALKLQPFVVGELLPQAKAFSKEQIISCVRLCVETEEAVKSGRLADQLAVELLLTQKYGGNE